MAFACAAAFEYGCNRKQINEWIFGMRKVFQFSCLKLLNDNAYTV